MFPLRCTVRDCCRPLRRDDRTLVCDAGHRFDRAREGYWNLTQPQDRRSAHPGDSDESVMARHRWLQRGHMTGLIDSLRSWMRRHCGDQSPAGRRTLDLGCGEGTFPAALFPEDAEHVCGIDLSKKAIRLAARRWPDATWVLANADRTLPAADHVAGRIVSLFGRRPVAEIRRVLAPDGLCVVAVPGEDDLIELRDAVQQSGHRRSRWQQVVTEFEQHSLPLLQHHQWSHQATLEPPALGDALAMTYRGRRYSQRERTESLAPMTVTLTADVMLFRGSASRRD